MNAVHLSVNKKCTLEKSIETITFLLNSKADMFITDNSDNMTKDMAIHLSKYSYEEKDRVGHWSNKEDKEYHYRVTASSNWGMTINGTKSYAKEISLSGIAIYL